MTNYNQMKHLLKEFSKKREKTLYDTFNYENPVAFAKENVVYILVVSEDKNYPDVKKMHDCILAGEKFCPDYMKKLEKISF